MIKLTDKTIKELADELGVTKQAVWQKINKQSSTDLRKLTTRKGNTIYISVDGQNLIKSMFYKKEAIKNHQKNDNKNDKELIFLRSLVDDLQAEKKELYRLLDQQQQLTLQSNQRIEKLEEQLQIENSSTTKKKPSKKWWHILKR